MSDAMTRRSDLVVADPRDEKHILELETAKARVADWLGETSVSKDGPQERGVPLQGANYWLPHDHLEQVRLDLQHHILSLLIDDKLHLAPINSPSRCLDFATGTGCWAFDFAQKYPECKVIGTDISAKMQPNSTPDNYEFLIQNAEEPWQMVEKFDLIHGRALVACFANNRTVVKNACAQLKSGGYLEIHDGILPFRCDDDSLRGTMFDTWQTMIFDTAMKKIDRNPGDSINWDKYMREEGLVDVTEVRYYAPLGPWARGLKQKIIGAALQQDMLLGSQVVGLPMIVGVLGHTRAKHDAMLQDVQADIMNANIHAYVENRVVYGRKP